MLFIVDIDILPDLRPVSFFKPQNHPALAMEYQSLYQAFQQAHQQQYCSDPQLLQAIQAKFAQEYDYAVQDAHNKNPSLAIHDIFYMVDQAALKVHRE